MAAHRTLVTSAAVVGVALFAGSLLAINGLERHRQKLGAPQKAPSQAAPATPAHWVDAPRNDAPPVHAVFNDAVADIIAEVIAQGDLDPLRHSLLAEPSDSAPVAGVPAGCPRELYQALRRQDGVEVPEASPVAVHPPVSEDRSRQPYDPEGMWRSATRQLDRAADELEDLQAFDEADAVRQLASQVRSRRHDERRTARQPTAPRWH